MKRRAEIKNLQRPRLDSHIERRQKHRYVLQSIKCPICNGTGRRYLFFKCRYCSSNGIINPGRESFIGRMFAYNKIEMANKSNKSFPVEIWFSETPSQADIEKIEKSIASLLDAFGFQVKNWGKPIIGSYLRKFLAWTKSPTTKQEFDEQYDNLKNAIKLSQVEKRQSRDRS